MIHFRCLVVLLALSAPFSALADTAAGVPLVMTTQGRLLGANDTPVDAKVEITFELHKTDNPSIHNPAWFDKMDVTVSKGAYGVVLGDTVRGGKALDTGLLAEPELFLSVTIAGAELQPRTRLGSAPYALRAGRAAEAEHVLANSIGTAELKDGSVTLAKLALADGRLPNLDADTLDGKDSAAFAPASIETKIDAIKTTVEAGATAAALTSLDGKVAALSATTSTLVSTLDAGTGGLGTKVDGVGSKVDTATTKIDAVGTKVDAVGAKVDTGSAKVDTLSGKLDTTTNAKLATLETKLGDLATAVSALSTKLDASTYGMKSCPSGMKLIGNAGDADAYCIDVDRSGSNMDFAAAHRYCRDQSKHLCTRSEYLGACGVGGLVAMENANWTWVDQIFTRGTDGTYMLDMCYGGGPCRQATWDWGGEHNNQGAERSRCCKGPRGQ